MISDERYNKILESSEFKTLMKAKLEHLQRFLHGNMASVMVGAGFSRNAEKGPDVEVKDWTGLAKDFYKMIYGEEPSDSKLALKSPLRLASQVEAQFHRHTLDEIIENAVPDDKIKPGPLHYQLVKLPWKDIFTTNYDTLLERANEQQNAYQVVTNKETLLYKPQKRIIKLHGSYPDIKPYVISEEDYRTYPDCRAEFVNTVRQSLIESVLCLVGFSGDDPNFLSWVGWIRDKMGKNLAPIYMLDVSRDGLHESELALFRDRYIDVIPMPKALFEDNIPEYFGFIFKFLAEKPAIDKNKAEWSFSVQYSDVSAISSIRIENKSFCRETSLDASKKLLDKYKAIRTNYPGWLFMPITQLEKGFDETFTYELRTAYEIFDKIDKEQQINLLYELEWRMRMSFTPMSMVAWMPQFIEKMLNDYSSNEILNDIRLITLSIALMSYYRNNFDRESFETIASKIRGVTNTSDADNIRRYYYELCLFEAPFLNYQKIRDTLALWSPASGDYMGILWKSVVMTEIGLNEEAYALLLKTYQQIQNSAINTTNVALTDSAMAIFESVIAQYEPFSRQEHSSDKTKDEYRIYRYFRYLKGNLQDQRDKNATNPDLNSNYRTHEFNLQAVVTHYNMDSQPDNLERIPASRLLTAWESFGYPFMIGPGTINSNMMRLCCDSLFRSGYAPLAISALIRSGQKDTMNKILSKENIMSINKELVELLSVNFLKKTGTISDWNTTDVYTRRMELIVTQVLRKFSVVLDSESNERIVPILLEIRDKHMPDFKSEYLRTVYNNLSQSSLKKIFPSLSIASLEDDSHRVSLIFPNVEADDITIPDGAIQIIKEGFNSENKQTREHAYLRLTEIYNFCTPDQQQILNECVIKWRETDIDTRINATYSFNIVDAQKTEKVRPQDRIAWAIDKLKSAQNASSNNGQKIIAYSGKANDALCVLEALCKRVVKTDIPTILDCYDKKLAAIIDQLGDETHKMDFIFGDNISYDLRCISFVISHLPLDNINPELIGSLLSKYELLLEKEYPRFFAIDALNSIVNRISEPDFEAHLRKMVFSSNEKARKNALAYISSKGFDKFSKVWERIWMKIEYSTSIDIADYINSILDTCENYSLDVSTIPNIGEIFNNMNSSLNQQHLLDGDLYDIQYQMFRLAGYVSQCNPDDNLKKALEAWIPKADAQQILPNDVLMGYENGKLIWIKQNNKEL